MKVSDVSSIYNGLSTIVSKRVPVRMGFIVNRNLRKIEPIMQDVEKQKVDILKKYADDSDETSAHISKEKMGKFMKDINEMGDVEVELVLDKILMEDIEKCDNDEYDSLTIAEMNALEKML